MRALIAILTPALALALAGPVRADEARPKTPQEIARTASPSVVMVVLQEDGGDRVSQGSGFFVGNGLVVTNFHVIAGAREGWVRVIGQEKRLPVEGVVATDRAHDLAILRIAGEGAPALPRGSLEGLSIADKVYALGNPHGLEGTFSEGILSSIRRVEHDKMLQITAPISQGSSGGPVFDDRGRVIGVAVGMLKQGQNLNFAIPIDYVENLLASVGAPVPLHQAASLERGAPVPPRFAAPEAPRGAEPSEQEPREDEPSEAEPPQVTPGPVMPNGIQPIDCGTFTCQLPPGWSLERNDTGSAAFRASRRQGGFALLTVFFRDRARGDVDDVAGSAIARLGDKYLKHRVVDLAGERAYLIMYKAAVKAGPVLASDLRVIHADVEYTISLWSDANASDVRAIGEEFEALARSWTWR